MSPKGEGAVRSTVIASMRDAFRKGQAANKFIAQMKAKGLSYRRSTMLADWRSVNEVERKEGQMRHIRKDYFPAERSLAAVEWSLSQEYMYKVKTLSRIRPDEPIVERFVNILSDTPLTPRQVEQQVYSRWGEWEKYQGESLSELVVWSAYRRVQE